MNFGSAIRAVPARGQSGTVYFPTADGYLNAVTPQGDILWRRLFVDAGEVCIAPDGTIYFSATRTNGGLAVFALDVGGDVLWERPVPGPLTGGVGLGSDGTIYATIAAQDEQRPALFALRPADGSIRWQAPIDHDVPTPPVIGPDETIYFGARNGYLQAFDTNGVRLWITNSGGSYLTRPLIDSRGVIVYGGGDAWAQNPDGRLLWRYSFAFGGGGPNCIGPDDTVYSGGWIGPGGSKVTAINTNGVKKWDFPIPNDCRQISIDSAGIIYATANPGVLIAMTQAGSELWRRNISGAGATLITPENVLYLTANSTLYAIQIAGGVATDSPWPEYAAGAERNGRARFVPTPPGAVSNFTATFRTRVTDIRLQWSSTPSATHYELFRATNADFSNAVLLAQVHGLNFDDNSAVPERNYTYWLRAINAGGTGPLAVTNGTRRQAVTGELLYTWNLQGAIEGAPAVGADGNVYVTINQASLPNGEHSGRKVVAVKGDGTIAWQREFGYASYSSPAVAADGTIVFGTSSSVLALNPDGSTRWEFPGHAVPGGVAFDADGTILFGTHDSFLFALTPEGTELWHQQINPTSEIFAPPVIGGDGAIYVLTASGWIHAFEPEGTNRWSIYVGFVSLGDSPWPGLCIDGDGIIYASTGGGLTSVETDGTIRWKAGSTSFTTPVVSSLGDLIVGSGSGTIDAFTSDGSNRWSFPNSTSYHLGAAAVASNGSIYVGTYQGKLQAVSALGSNLWQTTLTGAIRVAPTIAPDGTIYVVTSDGKLHSIFASSPLANTAWPMFQRDIRHTGRAVTPDSSMVPPSGVKATDGSFHDRVRLTWRSLHGATSYEIWRINASNLFDVTMVGTATASTNFDDLTAAEGVSYFFFVRGINRAGASAFSVPDFGHRAILPSLQARPVGNQLILSWSTNAVGFMRQSTFSLTPPVTWIDESNAPVLIGGQWIVTNSLSVSNKFFRLYKP